jgi:hypothetical protein
MRRGSQDYEYFWLLSQSGGKATVDDAVKAVLHGTIDDKTALGAPGMWAHDPDEWDRVRVKIGEAIEKLQSAHKAD